jgi:arylsulfatase A-like enzyme/Flp pilus assembly protein TadD
MIPAVKQTLARSLIVLAAGLLLGSARRPAPPPAPPDRSPRPDVVLITIDTLRADALGFAGNRRAATPVLDRLAAAGRVFPNTHAHNVMTLPSHTNILTGLYPYQHGVRGNSGFRLAPSIPTLATLLRAAGYRTGAFIGGFPLDAQFGLNRGFDVYDCRMTRGAGGGSFAFAERRGDEVVAAALAWWRQQPRGRPRFLWVHLFDPHAPYDPPEPFRSRFAANLYLGEVAAADSFLAPLLGPLLDGRAAPQPFVVVTADHGESLGEHGELTHGLFAYEATLKVPLVLWGRGVTPGRDLRPARHVDILPTVLQAAGLVPPAGGGRVYPGRSLLAPAAAVPEDSYFEALAATLDRAWAPLRGLIRRGRKFISLPLPEVYDLASDPREAHNLYAREHAWAREASLALPKESSWPPRRQDLPPESVARLESLGYLAAAGRVPVRFGPDDDPKRLIGLDRKMHEVVDLSSQGRLDAAVRLAREVVSERPQMSIGQRMLAETLLAAGRTQEALAAMEAARRRGAASPELLRQLGLTLAQVGKTAEALAILGPLAADGSRQSLDALALALSQAGRLREASAVARRAIAADPGNARAYQQMGLIELRLGRWSEARGHLRQAVALDPRLPIAWNSLGVALYHLGEPGAAFVAWQQALALQPDLWDTLWNLATKAQESGWNQLALLSFERFLAAAPPDRYGEQLRQARLHLAQLKRGPA